MATPAPNQMLAPEMIDALIEQFNMARMAIEARNAPKEVTESFDKFIESLKRWSGEQRECSNG